MAIIPFKPLGLKQTDFNETSYIWNVKCDFIACDEEDDDFCKLDNACPGRYDFIDNSRSVQERKRRSNDGKTKNPFTVSKIVEHPCAYADHHTSLCDGKGENCWTQEVCEQIYNPRASADYAPTYSASADSQSVYSASTDSVSADSVRAELETTGTSSAVSAHGSALIMFSLLLK